MSAQAQVSVSLAQPIIPCPPRYVTTFFQSPTAPIASACGEVPACTLQVDNTRQFLYGNPTGGVVVDVVEQPVN